VSEWVSDGVRPEWIQLLIGWLTVAGPVHTSAHSVLPNKALKSYFSVLTDRSFC
jgi:hypothetical protein